METIRQTVVIDCPAHAVYEAFMDQDEHEELTGAPAVIEATVGGRYQAYNGDLEGEFTRLEPDRLIILRWRSQMPGWPEDHYAVVEMELIQSSDGTTVEFTASDVPAHCADSVEAGWTDYYWEPLGRRFAW